MRLAHGHRSIGMHAHVGGMIRRFDESAESEAHLIFYPAESEAHLIFYHRRTHAARKVVG